MGEIIPVILAAGRGSRLGIDHMPKPMVPLAGRPLMQNAVESLSKMGFGAPEIKAVIGYKGEVIKGYFGGDLGYFPQKELNGNAGALESAFSRIKGVQNEHILTIQGDDTDQATTENLQRLIHFHLGKYADVTILTANKPDPDAHKIEYLYDNGGRVTEMIPKEGIDGNGRYTAGIYLFSGSFLGKFLPILRKITPERKELGISTLIRVAIETDLRVFQLCSHKDYISANTPRGLQHLKVRRTNQ